MNKVDLALEVAARAHLGQLRKGTDVPYIAHPCGVGLILARAGCAEDVVAAGILHDTIEDTGLTLEEIAGDFGAEVAAIVEACSEPDKSLPWEERKRHAIESLREAPEEARLVTCADKLHNARSILAGRRALGERVWDRFRGGKELQAWYYRGVLDNLDALEDTHPSLFEEFRDAVAALFA